MCGSISKQCRIKFVKMLILWLGWSLNLGEGGGKYEKKKLARKAVICMQAFSDMYKIEFVQLMFPGENLGPYFGWGLLRVRVYIGIYLENNL